MTDPSPPPAKPGRLVALDAFRGAIMIFLVSRGLGFYLVARKLTDSSVWRFLGYNTEHTAWVGGGAWDMIQPAFMFMVGVAVPFSFAARRAKGETFGLQLGHAVRRSLILIVLAIFLASQLGVHHTAFLFTNVLGQIGLGYLFVFLLTGRGAKTQWTAIAAIAVAYWLAFALYPLPGPNFNYAAVGVKPSQIQQVVLPGFFGHWSMNSNFASNFDVWFLNLFPGDKPYRFNLGGYETLNFVPSLITMILGLVVGEKLLRPGTHAAKARWLVVVGALCLGLGLLAGATVCPIVKRIWTPSYALFSGGIVIWALAVFYAVIEIRGWKRWTYPLVVVGMNSIAIYLMDELLRRWVQDTIQIHFGTAVFHATYGPILLNAGSALVFWLVCWWMYRRKIFLKI